MNAQNKYVSKSINLFLALLLVSITLLGGCAPASIDSEEPEPIEIEQDPTGGEQVPTEIPELSVGKGIQPVQELNTEMVLQDNVYKLEQQTVEAIREYHPESGEIIIPTNAPFVNQIQEGKIIVYGISDKTPEGLLRRVVSIEPDIVYVSKTADASRGFLFGLLVEMVTPDMWTAPCSHFLFDDPEAAALGSAREPQATPVFDVLASASGSPAHGSPSKPDAEYRAQKVGSHAAGTYRSA